MAILDDPFGVGLMSGQEIYDNFQNGAGAESLAGSAAIVNEIAKEYFGISVEMQRLAAEMNDAWQGDAADSSQRGAGPMLHEHANAGIQLSTAQDLSGRQAGSFGDAKYSVMPVPPEPTEVLPWVLGSPEESPTYMQELRDHKQAAQHNVDVMNSYTGASTYNTDGMPASYGELAADQAGITVGGTNIIDHGSPGDTGDTGGHSGGPRGGAPGPAPGGEPGPGSVTPAPDPGDTADNSTTTPERHTPAPPGNTPSVADPVRPAPTSGPGPGVGIGLPGPGGGSGGPGGSGGGRGGSTGATPRGGPVPRGAGPGTGAQPFGPGGRGAPSAGGVAAAGRGSGAGFGGMPMGAGRGGDEDREHKRPAYLEADDPEGIFGTEVLTAPPVIGDEDDED